MPECVLHAKTVHRGEGLERVKKGENRKDEGTEGGKKGGGGERKKGKKRMPTGQTNRQANRKNQE